MKRAVGYLRVSPSLQQRGQEDFGAQREQVIRLAEAKGYELVELIEATTSGIAESAEPVNGQAASLLKLMERAQAHDFDALIVAAEDRLSDEPAAASVVARHFRRYGVEVLAATVRTVASVGESEIRLQRFSVGKARKKALGRHVHGRAPYGYRSEGGVLEPIDALIPIVRRIFEEAAAGHTPGSIARGLNHDEIAAPQGGRGWTEQSLRVILGNVAYTGERYGVKGAHAALVSRGTWSAAQSALKARSRQRAHRRAAVHDVA
jgi:DNA invertase Pin-like site-specific DNA recombinase